MFSGKRWFFYFAACVLFLACAVVVVTQPNRFQKWNSLKPIDWDRHSRSLSIENNLALEPFVGRIPYKNGSDYVYAVYPRNKYDRTIGEGHGDCSTMSFGAAYYLLKNNISFELIHFLPPDALFSGGGHVALRLPYEYRGETRVGILDLAGGGLPLSNGDFLDIVELEVKGLSASLHQINRNASAFYGSYYKREYLETVYFGFTPSSEVERYYRFLERVYVPLGNERIEKMAYDGLAILLGRYYSIYVEEAFFDGLKTEKMLFSGVLLFIRIFLVAGIFVVAFEMYMLVGRKRNSN